MRAIMIPEHTPPMPQANTPTENLNPRDDSEIPLMPQPKYEKLSPKMAEMMKEYHGKTLQNDGIDVDKEERETMITQTLSNLTNAPIEENKVKFTLKTKRDEVLKPLRLSKNGSAPGINRATNKFFKVLNDQHVEDERKGIPSFDIVGVLTEV